MNYKLFLTSFLLLLMQHSKAQEVRFGVRGGLSLSNIPEINASTNARTSFHLGGVMEALYDDKIAIQPEIIFSQQGFDYAQDGVERVFKLSYVHVPVMIKYYVSKNVYVESGPQIGFLYSAELNTTVDGEQMDIDIKEGMRSNDLSLNVGLGFQVKKHLNLTARYCYGLTNVVDRLPHKKFKNRIFQVSVGYFF